MALIMISIDRLKMPKHTQEDFEEWVKYHVHQTIISEANPLADVEFEGVVREISK